MWTVVFTKTFFLQFLNLTKDGQLYVLESIRFLMDVLDLKAHPKYDIIDEYENGDVENKPFPLTYHVDHEADKVYFINIGETYRQFHQYE